MSHTIIDIFSLILRQSRRALWLSETERRRWAKRFMRYFLDRTYPEHKPELVTAFFDEQHTSLKQLTQARALPSTQACTGARELVCITVVRNDLERMRLFLSHYRQIGVHHFAIVDNDSSDGTRQYLSSQPDVDLYAMDCPFSGIRKCAVINRLLSIYGEERWYLVIDSDELMCYHGMEGNNINDLTTCAAKRGIKVMRGYMVDMYASDIDLSNTLPAEEIEQTCPYFDTQGYQLWDIPIASSVWGGPRQRLYGYPQLLLKMPLFFHTRLSFFATCHYLYPAVSIEQSPYTLALKHYKLIGLQDVDNYRERLKKGFMLSDSREYQAYDIEKEQPQYPKLTHEESRMWLDNTTALDALPFIHNIFAD